MLTLHSLIHSLTPALLPCLPSLIPLPSSPSLQVIAQTHGMVGSVGTPHLPVHRPVCPVLPTLTTERFHPVLVSHTKPPPLSHASTPTSLSHTPPPPILDCVYVYMYVCGKIWTSCNKHNTKIVVFLEK